MTLSDEILKLQTNLADSYTACNGKGATMPANQNFDNLPDCIDSIQTGGGSQNIDVEVTLTKSGATTYMDIKFSDNITNLSEGWSGTSNSNRLFKNAASINFNNIAIISSSCRYLCDSSSSHPMSSIDVSNIEQVGIEGSTDTYGMSSAFRTIGNISINFAKLKHIIGRNGTGVHFNKTFESSSGTTISFPALEFYNATSEGRTYPVDGQFTGMLTSSTNCTVHFPSNLQSTMSSWTSVTNGFGGTNTTVLFDLPATT